MRSIILNSKINNFNNTSKLVMHATTDSSRINKSSFTPIYSQTDNVVNCIPIDDFRKKYNSSLCQFQSVSTEIINHCNVIMTILFAKLISASEQTINASESRLDRLAKSTIKREISFYISDVIHCVAMDNFTGKTTLFTKYPELFLDIDSIKSEPEQEAINQVVHNSTPGIGVNWALVDQLHSKAVDRHFRENPSHLTSKVLLIHNLKQLRYCEHKVIVHAHLTLIIEEFQLSQTERMNKHLEKFPSDEKGLSRLLILADTSRQTDIECKFRLSRKRIYYFLSELIIQLRISKLYN